MLDLVFSFYLLITVILLFIRIKWGVYFYFIYVLLVPYFNFFSFGENLVSLLVFLALIYNYGFKHLYYKPLLPFFILFLLQLLIIPLHDDIPYSMQLGFFRSDFMSLFILPLAMINVIKNNRDAIEGYSKLLIFIIIIAVGYTFFLTTTGGLNPYIIAISSLKGTEYNETYALAEDGGRVFGRISGIFRHPMTNGLFLCFSAIFVFSKLDINRVSKSKFYLFLFILVILSVFLIGVRSAIGALAISFALFFLLERKFKLALVASIVLGLLLLVIIQIPGMDSFILSIVDSGSSEVRGSSTEMREEQFLAVFDAIKHNFLFGNGYAWTANYRATIGLHPRMLAFESLIIVILANNGLIGIIFWAIMIIQFLLLINRQLFLSSRNILITLLSTYLVYSIITGEYGYMKYFLVFYVVMFYNEKIGFSKVPRSSKPI